MIKIFLALLLILVPPIVEPLETLSLSARSLEAKGWKFDDITIALSGLTAKSQQLTLSVARLLLPKPFEDLRLVNIQCSAFRWQNQELLCERGKASVRSKQWQSPETQFSFHIRKNRNTFKLSSLQLAGGSFAISAEETGELWTLQVNAKNINNRFLQKLAQPRSFELKEGQIAFNLLASGIHAQIHGFKLSAEIDGLTLQSPSGRYAAEKLSFTTHLKAKIQNDLWQWQNQTQLKNGALYIDPVYLETGAQDIRLEVQGDWDSAERRAKIGSIYYRHSPAAEINGKAILQLSKNVMLEKADVSLRSQNLQNLSAIYLKPFFGQTALEGISISGNLKADFSINQQSLNALAVSFNNLEMNDEADLMQIKGGAGTINWANNEAFTKPSQLGWQLLKIRALPFGPSGLTFLSKAKNIRLLKKTTLPFLGGEFTINQFYWQAKPHDEPDVTFEGDLNHVSLAQLSKALKWTPLSGSISGAIPRISYRNKTLTLDSNLTVNVFDGNVTVTQLASSGLFSDYPIIKADLEINNLDLEQLTSKFEFGNITGKLSGFIRKLQLENWKPVTFYAWLGTPDNDDSRHRISQQAVKNIASIGGGGASDLLSRSFLSFFETFGYDKLGLGCYLHEGVCQLTGVEATASGYAIITGGGLPRIDVIGYNSRLDWNVLLERLGRISTSKEVIVK